MRVGQLRGDAAPQARRASAGSGGGAGTGSGLPRRRQSQCNGASSSTASTVKITSGSQLTVRRPMMPASGCGRSSVTGRFGRVGSMVKRAVVNGSLTGVQSLIHG